MIHGIALQRGDRYAENVCASIAKAIVKIAISCWRHISLVKSKHQLSNIQGFQMSSTESLKSEVFSEISKLLENKSQKVTDDMPLIGSESVLDSMKLVELCLALEDKAADMGFEFDWTSDAAMSRSRSMFRTAGSLATEFFFQLEAKK